MAKDSCGVGISTKQPMTWQAEEPTKPSIRMLRPISDALTLWFRRFHSFLASGQSALSLPKTRRRVFCKREPKAPTVNKRQQIEQLVSSPMPSSGHAWEIRSRHPTNLTAACSTCGLWIQQVDPPVLFKQTLNQPCLGRDGSPPPYFAINPSHKLVSVGKGWQCTVCEGILPARARKVPRIMTANCVVRHKTNALSNSTRGLLSGMGAPSNIPLSGRLGRSPKTLWQLPAI